MLRIILNKDNDLHIVDYIYGKYIRSLCNKNFILSDDIKIFAIDNSLNNECNRCMSYYIKYNNREFRSFRSSTSSLTNRIKYRQKIQFLLKIFLNSKKYSK